MRHHRFLPAAAVALALAGTTFAQPAHAADPTDVVGGLVTPLSLAIDTDGTVYVTQNFMGVLTRATPGEEPEDIYTDPQHREVGGVSASDGAVTFTVTSMDEAHPGAKVLHRAADGTVTTLANTYRFEKAHNPDAKQTYGVVGITEKCRASKPRKLATYTGIVESHPYATAQSGGVTYVADAAANAIIKIGEEGDLETVAVLPATRIALTKQVRNALGLPRCSRTGTLKVEPVPTDVEVDGDGDLYVTSLPGGPEDPSLGAQGRVYRISPGDGEVTRVAQGLMSPTGLGLNGRGRAYVAQLFAGSVALVPFGEETSTYADVPFPGDVEVDPEGNVYVTRTDLANDGSTPPDGAVVLLASVS